MRSIAIITARGGSKRIPRKNIKNFCGKPIIAYSIQTAIESNIFDEIMVSTDDEEIAEIAKKYGAHVPFTRSEAASNDTATTLEVLKEVINTYEKQNEYFDVVACLYPTAPLVTSEKLIQAYKNFMDNHADCLCPVVEYSFPPQRASVIVNGWLKYKWPENYPKRTQDLESFYYDCGQFYFYTTEAMKTKNKIDMKELPFIMSQLEVQDIDNESDWKLAEIKYQMQHNNLTQII